MVQSELATFLKNSKIPMKIVRGLPFKGLLEASKNGPVFYGMRYGSAPPATTPPTRTGRPRRAESNVADMRHAVVMLGFREFPAVGNKPARVEVYRKDPNHGSAKSAREAAVRHDLRAERPGSSTRRITTSSASTFYAAIPTRAMQVIGSFKAAAPAAPPPLVLTALKPFDGTAEIDGDRHFAVQLAGPPVHRPPDGLKKDVVALGRLSPRLPGPAGDRTNVALVGDEAAILLRADIILRDRAGNVLDRPATEAGEDPPPGPADPVPGRRPGHHTRRRGRQRGSAGRLTPPVICRCNPGERVAERA